MKTLIAFFLSFLPSFFKNKLLNLMGYRIEKGAKIRPGAILRVESLTMKENSKIGSFSYVNAENLFMGSNSHISALSLIKCRVVDLGEYSKISPFSIILSAMEKSSLLRLGKHSQIFPFCWIEPGEGIKIGSDTGIGGHTLIFTHGVWSDYLKNGPVKHASVEIGDHVWLPWRVFVMPGTKIGDNSIIAAGSVISGEVKSGSLYGGMPAKLLKDDVIKNISQQEKKERVHEIFNAFNHNHQKVSFSYNEVNRNCEIVFFSDYVSKETLDACRDMNIDLIDYENKEYFYSRDVNEEVLSFFRRYGIRLGRKKFN
jgi:acetyltransferase-like isoleucine patch superfamily enzyme